MTLVWPAFGFVYAWAGVLDYELRRLPRPNIASVTAFWIAWGVLTPFVVRYAQKHVGTLLPHIAAIVGFGSIVAAASTLLPAMWNGTLKRTLASPRLPVSALTMLSYGACVYLCTAAATWLVTGELAAARRRLHAAHLRQQLASDELATFKIRLRADVVTQSLARANALLRSDPAAAEQLIHRVARLFRSVLDQARQPIVPLIHELTSFEEYLGVMAAAYGRSIRTSRSIDHEDSLAGVPPRILHGATHELIVVDDVTAAVTTRHDGNALIVRVDLTGFAMTQSNARLPAAMSSVDTSDLPHSMELRIEESL